MVLLHALHALGKKNQWEVAVAHFNHRLRGRASERDEKLVRETSAGLRLGFFESGTDVKKTAARLKISIEMASRKLRHEFLARTAREQNIPTVALAHHADDQVELFFVRLLRGTSGEGLAGMKWRSPSPADRTISLVRPLLSFSKAELMDFAHAKKLPYRTDATNFSADFLRNQIRNELLVLLRENYQPGVDKAVLRLMDIVGAEAEFVNDAAKKFCAGLDEAGRPAIGSEPGPPRADVQRFGELALAIQRRVLQQQLARYGLMPDFDLIEQLRLAPGKSMSVAPGVTVERDGAGKVSCREHLASEFNSAILEVKVPGKQGRGEFEGLRFRWKVEPMKRFKLPPKKFGDGRSAFRECFDADKIGGEIMLRHWRAGDRFQPIGLKSAVKLQDLFVNAKIPADQRRELVLAATKAGEIFWVEGLRIGEQFKLTPGTTRKFVWQGRRVAAVT